MALRQSGKIERTLGRFLQEEIRQAEHYLAGIRRRGALLWLDRRYPQENRRRELPDSFLAAKAQQHLERGEHSQRRETDQRETDAAWRPEGV